MNATMCSSVHLREGTYFHLVLGSCGPCTAELKLEEGEAAQEASNLNYSVKRKLNGGKNRVTDKLTSLLLLLLLSN